jgi:hypothetical protein
MTTTEPNPEDGGQTFGDEGAGPEEPDEVINQPENQAAATAIRESTLEAANTFGDLAEGDPPEPANPPLPA